MALAFLVLVGCQPATQGPTEVPQPLQAAQTLQRPHSPLPIQAIASASPKPCLDDLLKHGAAEDWVPPHPTPSTLRFPTESQCPTVQFTARAVGLGKIQAQGDGLTILEPGLFHLMLSQKGGGLIRETLITKATDALKGWRELTDEPEPSPLFATYPWSARPLPTHPQTGEVVALRLVRADDRHFLEYNFEWHNGCFPLLRLYHRNTVQGVPVVFGALQTIHGPDFLRLCTEGTPSITQRWEIPPEAAAWTKAELRVLAFSGHSRQAGPAEIVETRHTTEGWTRL